MSIHFNQNNTVKKVKSIYANVGGSVKKIKSVWVDRNGTPTKVYGSAPENLLIIGAGANRGYSSNYGQPYNDGFLYTEDGDTWKSFSFSKFFESKFSSNYRGWMNRSKIFNVDDFFVFSMVVYNIYNLTPNSFKFKIYASEDLEDWTELYSHDIVTEPNSQNYEIVTEEVDGVPVFKFPVDSSTYYVLTLSHSGSELDSGWSANISSTSNIQLTRPVTFSGGNSLGRYLMFTKPEYFCNKYVSVPDNPQSDSTSGLLVSDYLNGSYEVYSETSASGYRSYSVPIGKINISGEDYLILAFDDEYSYSKNIALAYLRSTDGIDITKIHSVFESGHVLVIFQNGDTSSNVIRIYKVFQVGSRYFVTFLIRSGTESSPVDTYKSYEIYSNNGYLNVRMEINSRIDDIIEFKGNIYVSDGTAIKRVTNFDSGNDFTYETVCSGTIYDGSYSVSPANSLGFTKKES